MTAPQQVIWTPSETQAAMIACPVEEIFFGGARGGGKTEGSIGDWLDHSNTYGAAASGVFFRKTLPQLDHVKKRTRELYTQIGAKYNDKHSTWTMPGGAELKFRYLERDSDAEQYQGHEYTRVYFEELTNYATATPVNMLRAAMRSSKGVPVGMRCTGNPGGPGHQWVKARYIDPAPKGWHLIEEDVKNLSGAYMTTRRIFIPSKLQDNPTIFVSDPYYVARLRQSGSEALVMAWLEGNWDVVMGAFFDCWGDVHVLRQGDWLERIPKYATRFRAMDWGYARPFSVGWYAMSDGTWGLPQGAMLKYREWYGSNGKPNEGLRMAADLVAKGILARDGYTNPDGTFVRENLSYCVADPSMFIRDGGPSIADTMMSAGLTMHRADNKRIPGWTELRRRLTGQIGEDVNGQPVLTGRPLIYFLGDGCQDSIRTIPLLQHDETKFEDIDTDMEDHAADETRYACMSQPWVTTKPEEEDTWRFPKLPSEMTINELIERQTAKRKAAEEWA